jgi:beta-lactam-binding protein with PASTA domain
VTLIFSLYRSTIPNPTAIVLRRIRDFMTWARPVVFSRYIVVTLVSLVVLVVVLYSLVNLVVMPLYTRHNVGVSVPDTRGLPVDEAEAVLFEQGLDVRRVVSQFVPSFPRNAVVDQDPKPHSVVKPGRRIYLRVNSGRIPMIIVPTLYDLSIRQARNSLVAEKLTMGAVLRDTIPSPYRNTVTRQDPVPGDSVTVGSAVDIWISSGLGTTVATVPEVIGVPLPQAEAMLRAARLQFVVFDDPDARDADPNSIVRVIPPAGTEIQEGSEVRLFVAPDTAAVY